MRILIIEDEAPAARQLSKLILEARPSAIILGTLDSIESAVNWFFANSSPDLIFMDIQLADGLSFDIFNQVQITVPVIFTTAFDQYTLRAFKVNSVDYLLKPIDPAELEEALGKFEAFFKKPVRYENDLIQQLIRSVSQPDYKERFLIKIGQQLSYLRAAEIRYFFSEDGLVYALTRQGKKHLIDYTLDQLEPLLSPTHFFRINRKIILHIESIHRIHPYFNSRLKLDLSPHTDLDTIVSRDRVSDFKKWLDQ